LCVFHGKPPDGVFLQGNFPAIVTSAFHLPFPPCDPQFCEKIVARVTFLFLVLAFDTSPGSLRRSCFRLPSFLRNFLYNSLSGPICFFFSPPPLPFCVLLSTVGAYTNVDLFSHTFSLNLVVSGTTRTLIDWACFYFSANSKPPIPPSPKVILDCTTMFQFQPLGTTIELGTPY